MRIFLLFLLLSSSAIADPVLLVVGTRPEAVKMAPVYHALKAQGVETYLCSTGQHAELLDEMLALFEMEPDAQLRVMRPGQDLFYLTARLLEKAKELFLEVRPSMVVVQGDTASAMCAAMAAFYLQIPVAHVEAGLRTEDMAAPFPEEFNRRMIGLVATLHFAPTEQAAANLLGEGVLPESILCTGNTVVDALYFMRGKGCVSLPLSHFEGKRLLLLTAHRRESLLDGGLGRIFTSLKRALEEHPDLAVLYPMHPNPRIAEIAEASGLLEMERVELLDPLSYSEMVHLMERVDGVLTDSGGVQEEAISLGRPLLVLRSETDRPEGLKRGVAELVGTDGAKIRDGIDRILSGQLAGERGGCSVYGDGTAGRRIANAICTYLEKRDESSTALGSALLHGSD